jgi:photosynthetic reaction center cytochrome c subunit
MGNLLENAVGGKRNLFMVIFATMSGVLVLSAYGLIAWVNNQVRVDDRIPVENELSPIYVDFFTDIETYVSGDSYQAMGNYAQDNPWPQNVQVLEGMTTHEINGYMMNHFVAGLQVNCTYCHDIQNFAAEEWGDTEEANAAEHNRLVARQHLLMTQDLNQNWLTMLPELPAKEGGIVNKEPTRVQVTCATCHYGQAQPNTYTTDTRNTLPAAFRLPLSDDDIFPGARMAPGEQVLYSVEEEGYLNVNGRGFQMVDGEPDGISLDATQLNQYVMYHMNSSMNVGCTHCHNSRYFPSYEVPAKYYAIQMLQMTQYIEQEWGEWLIVSPDDEDQAYPSCLMCHREAVIPPGAANNYDVMAPALVPEGSQSDAAAWGTFQGNGTPSDSAANDSDGVG